MEKRSVHLFGSEKGAAILIEVSQDRLFKQPGGTSRAKLGRLGLVSKISLADGVRVMKGEAALDEFCREEEHGQIVTLNGARISVLPGSQLEDDPSPSYIAEAVEDSVELIIEI